MAENVAGWVQWKGCYPSIHSRGFVVNKLVLDESLRHKLNGLTEPVEVCDPTGHTVGHFVPASLYHQLLYDGLESPISEEELQRRLQEPGGRTLAEIMADLERS